MLLGMPLAYVLARTSFPFKRLVNLLIELPIVMPPVVAGLALLMAFGRRGARDRCWRAWGLSLPFTRTGHRHGAGLWPLSSSAAQLRFAALPGNWRRPRPWTARAERLFGASRCRSPPRLLTGLMLSWSRALGEFGATILFAGNLRGRTWTRMPLLVYGRWNRGP
ncbi:MAG: hypothetical protein R2838_11015 [Caldilineaceae bacterium]